MTATAYSFNQKSRVFQFTNCHLYGYAGNNPVKYTAPDGRTFFPLESLQHQNSKENSSIPIGSFPSGNFDSNGIYKLNTVGSYGCLFMCTVNVGNSYNKMMNPLTYEEKSVASLASNDAYFYFYAVCNWNSDWAGIDFISGEQHLEKLLFDMTGVDFSVTRYGKDVLEISGYLVRTFKKGAYIIGKVGNHFINIIDIDKNNNMSYFDPYIRNMPKTYTFEDVEAFYFITTKEENYELN